MITTDHPVRFCFLVGLLWLIGSSMSHAHPLGNDSITHFSVLYVKPDRLEVDLLLDIAETPSMFIRAEEIDVDKDDIDTDEERQVWLEKKAAEYGSSLLATIEGKKIPLKVVAETVDQKTAAKVIASKLIVKIPGYMGMPTYRLLIRYAGVYPQPLNSGEYTISYQDTTYPENLGLKRILLERTSGVEIIPPHPPFWNEGGDPFIYEQYDPGNLPQERSAVVKFRVITPALAVAPATVPAAAQADVPPLLGGADSRPAAETSVVVGEQGTGMPSFIGSFTDPRNNPAQTSKYYRQADQLVGLLQGKWSFMMILSVTVLSFGWGAAHALMPGHAKTVVAAYLISQRGTYWHAVLLAVIVTITHTALVVALGLIIWLYQKSHPTLGARLQLWLGVVAGVLVAGMGFMLGWRAITGRLTHHHHDHDHHHDHHHDQRSWLKKLFAHSHPHSPTHTHTHIAGGDRLTVKMLLMLGVTGGLVPCPTATIIMLLGIGTNVVAGALYAVGIFSLGLALMLMLIGFIALSSRKFAARLLSDTQREEQLSGGGRRLLLGVIPAISGLVVITLGAAIAAHYIYMIQTGNRLFTWMG